MLRVYGPLTPEILFTAQRIPATRAHQLGVVHAIAPEDQVDQVAETFARTIAANAPLTLKAAKAAIRALVLNDENLIAQAEQLGAKADASNDYAEGRLAFAQKRSPRFTGT
jgi:enoyl-CoA hydratase/carnithine racemase